MKYWSGLQPLTGENSPEVTQQYINSTMFASQVIVASYSTLFYIVLLILSILGICYKPCLKIFTSQANLMLFLIGALLVFFEHICSRRPTRGQDLLPCRHRLYHWNSIHDLWCIPLLYKSR